MAHKIQDDDDAIILVMSPDEAALVKALVEKLVATERRDSTVYVHAHDILSGLINPVHT